MKPQKSSSTRLYASREFYLLIGASASLTLAEVFRKLARKSGRTPNTFHAHRMMAFLIAIHCETVIAGREEGVYGSIVDRWKVLTGMNPSPNPGIHCRSALKWVEKLNSYLPRPCVSITQKKRENKKRSRSVVYLSLTEYGTNVVSMVTDQLESYFDHIADHMSVETDEETEYKGDQETIS